MNDEMLITKRACSSFLLGLSPAFSASSFSQPPYSMCVSVLGSNLSPCLGKLRKIVDKLHLRRPLPQSCLPFFPIFLTVFPWLTFYLFVPALAFAPHPPLNPSPTTIFNCPTFVQYKFISIQSGITSDSKRRFKCFLLPSRQTLRLWPTLYVPRWCGRGR